MVQNYLLRWRALWDPDRYHGWGKRSGYFEGWYYKLVDPSGEHVLALIPGIAYDEEGDGHAFIQQLDGKACTATYHRFPTTEFRPDPNRFAVDLGENHFSAFGVRLKLPELRGSLQFGDSYPWPSTLGAPGIMGWYSFVPFMQCYHGVVSMDHRLLGHLEINGKNVDFSGGRGYIEKDWGRSFPSSWIWTQTNHFDTSRRVSLMASVARIPWLTGHFVGHIVGLLIDDRLYRFATYTGAKMSIELEEDGVLMSFQNQHHRLHLHARQGKTGELVSPLSGDMMGKVNESIQATVAVELYENDQLIFRGTGRHAGLEVAGPVEELLG